MKKATYLLATIALITFASCQNKTDSKDVAEDQNKSKFANSNIKDDVDFAVNAADGGMYEVKVGQLAVSRGTTDNVRKFGQMLIDDHGAANNELKALAQQKNITLPDSISQKMRDKYNDLAKKTGADFDKAFMDKMVDDHKKDIDAFEKEANNGNDADLKTWASNKLPTLRHHLEMAQNNGNMNQTSENK